MVVLFAHFIILIHAAWALFLAFGFVLVLRKSRLALLHLAGLLFSFLLNLMGWYCPLTYLENYFYSLGNPNAGYSSSFMMQYVYQFLYPDLPEDMIRTGEVVFVCLNLVGYVYLAKRAWLPEEQKSSARKRR